VDASLEQLLHGNDCHSGIPSLFFPPFASTPPGTMSFLYGQPPRESAKVRFTEAL